MDERRDGTASRNFSYFMFTSFFTLNLQHRQGNDRREGKGMSGGRLRKDDARSSPEVARVIMVTKKIRSGKVNILRIDCFHRRRLVTEKESIHLHP